MYVQRALATLQLGYPTGAQLQPEDPVVGLYSGRADLVHPRSTDAVLQTYVTTLSPVPPSRRP